MNETSAMENILNVFEDSDEEESPLIIYENIEFTVSQAWHGSKREWDQNIIG